MNKEVKLSTKGSNSRYRTMGIVSGAVYSLMGIVLCVMGLMVLTEEKEATSMVVFCIVIGLIALFIGLVEVLIKKSYGQTYIEFFDTYVEGFGVNGPTVDTFKIDNHQIINVTISGVSINIVTQGGSYKIIANQKVAQEVFTYAHANILNK